MTATDWFLDKGITIAIEFVVVPVGLYLLKAARQVVREFQAIAEDVKAHTSAIATVNARMDRASEDIAHLRLNVRDIGRYLQSSGTFKGFRDDEEKP